MFSLSSVPLVICKIFNPSEVRTPQSQPFSVFVKTAIFFLAIMPSPEIFMDRKFPWPLQAGNMSAVVMMSP